MKPSDSLKQDSLRRIAWEISEQHPAERFQPSWNHVGLAMVDPFNGFVHWRVLHSWVEQNCGWRGDAWRDCQMIIRLYDISYIEFNGWNAHSTIDIPIRDLTGQYLFHLPKPGTWQLAEVGFRLREGEFIPAARSHAVAFAADAVSNHESQSALLIDSHGQREEIGSLWEQGHVLANRPKPKLRDRLRIASFAWETPLGGQDSPLAHFVARLAADLGKLGHDVHLFVPDAIVFAKPVVQDPVTYHPLSFLRDGSLVEQALAFARAAEGAIQPLPPFDLFNIHEWCAGLAPWLGTRPTVLLLSSLELTRRGGGEASELSREIQKIERELAQSVDCILTPDWLHDLAFMELGIARDRVHPFPMLDWQTDNVAWQYLELCAETFPELTRG